MKMIRVVGKRGKGSFDSQLDEAAKGLEFVRIDCTSCNQDEVMNRGLSPLYLGPVECYDGLVRDEMWAKTEADFHAPGDMRRPAGNRLWCKERAGGTFLAFGGS